jgi:hypothetical protein
MSIWGLSFFALSSNHRTYLLDGYYLMSKFLSTSYSDYMSMPTYSREYLISQIIKHNSPKNDK